MTFLSARHSGTVELFDFVRAERSIIYAHADAMAGLIKGII